MSEKSSSIRQLAQKAADLLLSPSKRDERRQVTPPSPRPNRGGDPNITSLTLDNTTGPSPEDPPIGTPPTPQFWSLRGQKSKPAPSTELPEVPRPEPCAHAFWKSQGITGSDPSLPLFEGSTANLADHLIELEDDSMETAPDVRVYFWWIGKELQEDREESPEESMTLEERTIYDAKLVRQGRLFLKESRRTGRGYYVDKERLLAFDVAGRCPFGDRWYRMPAACIVEDASNHLIDGSKTEGALNIDNCLSHDDHSLWGFPLTNIRADLFFAESLKEGIVPGTIGFDDALENTYSRAHPVIAAWMGEQRYPDVHFEVFRWPNRPEYYYDGDLVFNKLVENWPNDDPNPPKEEREVPAGPPPDLLALQGRTAREFLMMPPTKKEKKQKAKQERKAAKRATRDAKKGR